MECQWYDVTFQELEVRDLPVVPSDSIRLHFTANPREADLYVTIDSTGVYPLSVTLRSVAPMRGDIDIRVRGLAPPGIYTWPDHHEGWKRNDPAAEGLHEAKEGNMNIIYTLRYSIECKE
jgi:hypothetical protein